MNVPLILHVLTSYVHRAVANAFKVTEKIRPHYGQWSEFKTQNHGKNKVQHRKHKSFKYDLEPIYSSYYEHNEKRLRWSRGSVLVFGTQVRGFKPDRSRRIFQDKKDPEHSFLRKGSKAVCPMS